MKKCYISLFASIFFITSCTRYYSPSVSYLGNNYTPTSTVDLYFDIESISRKYLVMGNAELILWKNDGEMVKQKIKETALKNGADGVIFEETQAIASGSTTSTQTQTNIHDTTILIFLPRYVNTVSTTATNMKYYFRARFIKYK
jgi:PBP1b-binding outer membrane lipoprotein LpoB